MLLENYGFAVIDLGKDVAPEHITNAAAETGSRLVGLSALMTTTAPAMAKTIALIKERGLDASVMVGGAVITPEFAASIGADHYAKDAAASVRIAQSLFDKQ